jgi:hypothetical protein
VSDTLFWALLGVGVFVAFVVFGLGVPRLIGTMMSGPASKWGELAGMPKEALRLDGDEWVVMQGMVGDGTPAIHRVNAAYAGIAGHPAFPTRITLTVDIAAPTASGFPSEEENKRLWALEDALDAALREGNQSVLVASVSGGGQRDLVVMTSDADAASGRIDAVLAKFPEVKVSERAVVSDPTWDAFGMLLGR